jgi:lipopolysaccharide exporter
MSTAPKISGAPEPCSIGRDWAGDPSITSVALGHIPTAKDGGMSESTPGEALQRAPAEPLFGRLSGSAARMVLLRLVVRMLGFISTLILARVLAPDDFGIVGIALSLIASLEAFTVFGANLAIVRERDVSRELYDTAWTIELARGVLIAALLAASGPSIAAFFSDPRIEPIMYAIAFGALVQGLENVGTIDFVKDLRFDRDFRFFLTTKAVAFVVTVTAALLLRNYWALVIGYLSHRLARMVLSYVMHPFRPRISLAALRQLFSFSSWIWASSIITFANSQGQTLIAGKIVGPQELGLFRVGSEVGALPVTEIQGPVQRVLFPGLSRVGSEPSRFAQLFADAFQTMLLIQAALSIGLALVAEPFVRILYGEHWLGMTSFVALAAAAALFQLPTFITEPLLIALGRLRLYSTIVLLSATVRLPILAISLHTWGLTGAGWALLTTALFDAVFTTAVIARVLHLRMRDLLRGTWRCVGAAGAMAGAVTGITSIWPGPADLTSSAAMLIVSVLVGGIAFATTQIALWIAADRPAGAEANLVRFARESIKAFELRYRSA